jgi:hypothetical protein
VVSDAFAAFALPQDPRVAMMWWRITPLPKQIDILAVSDTSLTTLLAIPSRRTSVIGMVEIKLLCSIFLTVLVLGQSI